MNITSGLLGLPCISRQVQQRLLVLSLRLWPPHSPHAAKCTDEAQTRQEDRHPSRRAFHNIVWINDINDSRVSRPNCLP